MKTEVNEIAPGIETVTAVIHESLETGESYSGPIVIGNYPDASELWIEREGQRVQFSADSLPAIIKQLRRAKAISEALEKKHESDH